MQEKTHAEEPLKPSMTMADRAMSREWKPKALEVPLDSFKKNPDGSWVTTKAVFMFNPKGVEIFLNPGHTFRRGKSLGYMGFDLAEYLDQHSKDGVP